MNIFVLLSPTWVLAYYLKRKYDRTKTIKTLNWIYLVISIIGIAIIVVAQLVDRRFIVNGLYKSIPIAATVTWFYFLMSRNNEIFWSFLKDACDKMDSCSEQTNFHKQYKSKLVPKDRIILSLKSYLELVFNFSIVYALTDNTLWKSESPLSIADFIYYSGITITTTGYGDITPIHYLTQLLAVYEIFCGVILLIVCFAIYAGRLNN